MAEIVLRRHTNADIATGTKLAFPEHATQSGICSTCTMCGQCEIGKKARTGQSLFPEPYGMQFGGEKRMPNLEDLQIIPELFGEEVKFAAVKTEKTIGSIKLKAPFVIAAMGSTKVAHEKGKILAEGAAKAGIGLVIGENMLATHGKGGMQQRIQPFLDNYDGNYGAVVQQGNPVDIENGVFETGKEIGVHAIEFKLGQGAKQGLGGEIKFKSKEEAEKYTKMGYHIVQNPDGSFQRHTPPGALKEEALRDLIIKYAELDLPMWAKIGMGKGIVKLVNSLNTIKKEQGVKFECLTIDGFGGGTGMSPWLIMNEMNIPSPYLYGMLEEKPNFDILLTGGIANGFDSAKAMMLGSSGVAMGRPFLIAAKTAGEEGIVKFVKAMQEEMQMISATMRLNSVEEMVGKRENLISLSAGAEEAFGISRSPKKVLWGVKMVSVDKEKCIGCGACVALCAEVFEMKDGKSHVKKNDDSTCAENAKNACPVQAISL